MFRPCGGKSLNICVIICIMFNTHMESMCVQTLLRSLQVHRIWMTSISAYFHIPKRKKKKDSSQVFAVHVNTGSVYKGHTHWDCLGVCLTYCETVCFLMQTMFKSVWLLVSPQGHPSRNNMCRDVHSRAFPISLRSLMVTRQ